MNGYYDLLFLKVFDAFNSQNDNLIFIAMGDDNHMKINKGFKSTKNSWFISIFQKKFVNLTQFQSVR